MSKDLQSKYFYQLADFQKEYLKVERLQTQYANQVSDLKPTFKLVARYCESLQKILLCQSQSESGFMATTPAESVSIQQTFHDQATALSLLKLFSEQNLQTSKSPAIDCPQGTILHGNEFPRFIREFSQFAAKEGGAILASSESRARFLQFEQANRELLQEDIRISSPELLHFVQIADQDLMRVSTCLKAFKTLLDVDQSEVRRLEGSIQSLISSTNEDFASLIRSGSHPQILREAIDLIILKIKAAGNIDAATRYLHNLRADSLLHLLRGGIPYRQRDILEANSGIKSKDLVLPDYMTTHLEERISAEAEGNDEWLIWIQSLQNFNIENTEVPKKKLAAFLTSDYLEIDTQLSKPSDKLWSLLRCYLNLEVFKRYILARKLINQNNMILFNESAHIEELFTSSDPHTILGKQHLTQQRSIQTSAPVSISRPSKTLRAL
jgi:hypothetical protein